MSEHSAVSSLGACRTPARWRLGELTCRRIRAGVLQPDMTFHVNRNVWFALFSYANEFPEGGVAVNLDGGSS
jgi:hypothetical protein